MASNLEERKKEGRKERKKVLGSMHVGSKDAVKGPQAAAGLAMSPDALLETARCKMRLN